MVQTAKLTAYKELTMSLLITSGLSRCVRNETKKLPQSEKGNPDTYRESINLVQIFLRQ